VEQANRYADAIRRQISRADLIYPYALLPTVNTKFPKDRWGDAPWSAGRKEALPHLTPLAAFLLDHVHRHPSTLRVGPRVSYPAAGATPRPVRRFSPHVMTTTSPRRDVRPRPYRKTTILCPSNSLSLRRLLSWSEPIQLDADPERGRDNQIDEPAPPEAMMRCELLAMNRPAVLDEREVDCIVEALGLFVTALAEHPYIHSL